MTPAEEIQTRREAQIRRAQRIDALDRRQLVNFIHRVAAIVPADIDRVLAEFDANMPKPRSEPKLHPVTFYASDIHGQDSAGGVNAYCDVCTQWGEHLDDGESLADFERLVRRHSGIETP